MTSNQINYWKNVETERSNKAQEAERRRHNTQEEMIAEARNRIEELRANIEARSLDIQQQRALAELVNIWETYGYAGISELPEAAQEAIAEAFGTTRDDMMGDRTTVQTLSSIWTEFWRAIDALGGGRGIAAMFF